MSSAENQKKEAKKMLPRTRITGRVTGLRLYTTQPTPSPPTNPSKPTKPPKVSAKERAELVSTSFKSVFEGILGNEETFENIDTKPIFAQPRKFVKLSQFHRDQVIEEVEKRMKQPWTRLDDDVKKMAYFISYGNWEARDGFKDNMARDVQPEDLPFVTPSKIKTVSPKADTKVTKLPEVDLWQVSETRRADYKKMTRRLDPVSKFVVYLAAVISLIALYRDKTIGEDGMVGEIPDSPYMLADLKRQEEYDAAELKKKQDQEQKVRDEEQRLRRKWYYLWLK